MKILLQHKQNMKTRTPYDDARRKTYTIHQKDEQVERLTTLTTLLQYQVDMYVIM